MIIKNFRVYRLQIPFSLPVSHNLAERGESEALLVMVESSEGIVGYGEGTPRQYVTGENIDSCMQAACELCGLLVQRQIGSLSELEDLIDSIGASTAAVENPSALCAVELSILDLFARIAGVPLWNLFADTPAAEEFTYSAVIPMLEDERLEGLLDYIHSQQILYAKVKISDVEQGKKYVSCVRQRLGPGINIRVDANGAFSWQQALEFIEIGRAAGFNISAIEQPVPGNDFKGMKRVTLQGGIPVYADESFRNKYDLHMLLAERVCSGFNIRLSKCGGFRNSLKFYNTVRKHGFACQIGCHVGETAVLAAAGRHLAALCGEISFLEGSYSGHVLREDISLENITFGIGGRASLISGTGLGITVDNEVLSRWGELIFEIRA